MASRREIQKRIKSVQNISQITKAMEVVSMNKMRRSQGFALAARPYAVASFAMLKNIKNRTLGKNLPNYFKKNKAAFPLLVVITTDKGLVGGFNDAVIARAEKWIVEQETKNKKYALVTVGKKSRDYFERRQKKIVKSFTDYGDFTSFAETEPIASFLLRGFSKHRWDSVDLIYTHFKTTLTQDVKFRALLPVQEESLQDMIAEIIPEYGLHNELTELKQEEQDEEHLHYHYSYRFEPSAESLLQELTEELIKIAFHHSMLESNASEHSSRMITMKNASENAEELEETLTLKMNKARQAGITAEISEIIAGAEALQ